MSECRYSKLKLGDRISWRKTDKPCYSCGKIFHLPKVKSTYLGHVTADRGDFGDWFRVDDPATCSHCGHVHYHRFLPCDSEQECGVAEALFSAVQNREELLEILNDNSEDATFPQAPAKSNSGW